MGPLQFFDDIVQHRNTLLSRFQEAAPEAFHEPLVEQTWSCELYFRHLLAGIKWMMDAIPGVDSAEYHPLVVQTRAWPEDHASWNEVKQALDEVTAETRKHLAQLAPESWGVQVQEDPSLTLEQCIYGLLEHEIEHHGMIRWILKRYINWDDDEMYQGEVP